MVSTYIEERPVVWCCICRRKVDYYKVVLRCDRPIIDVYAACHTDEETASVDRGLDLSTTRCGGTILMFQTGLKLQRDCQ